MKIENVQVRVEKQEEGKKVVGLEVFLTCGDPYINQSFHVKGATELESGVYTLSFEPQKAPRVAKEK